MKILVGISGGVDSAVAARLLLDMGHEVEGAVLIMHEHTDTSSARDVADSVGIALHEIDCSFAFESTVKKNFLDEYLVGRTPNPCIICNAEIKFKYLYDYAVKHGFDKIATGHYADVTEIPTGDSVRYAIVAGSDPAKDQSYMLYRLSQEILSALMLPLAEYNKVEIREIAARCGLAAANRADSLEICFVPDGDYAEYIESRTGKSPEGNFIDPEGRVIGRHKGIIRYTVGQRKGLGISVGERAFVTKINPSENTVTLSRGSYAVKRLILSDMVYSGMSAPRNGEVGRFMLRVRYKSRPVSATVQFGNEGFAELITDVPVSAAPGQSAVLYDCDRVMAGGFISLPQ